MSQIKHFFDNGNWGGVVDGAGLDKISVDESSQDEDKNDEEREKTSKIEKGCHDLFYQLVGGKIENIGDIGGVGKEHG